MKCDILLLLDTSGSMHGEKIIALNYAAEGFKEGLGRVTYVGQPTILVVTFGGSVSEPLSIGQIDRFCFEAVGETYLSEALARIQGFVRAETLCVLMSDGHFVDGDFTKYDRGRPFAIGIGRDRDDGMLAQFAGGIDRVFSPWEAERLPGAIAVRA